MSYNELVVKQIVAHPYHGILIRKKNKKTIDACSYLGESQGNYAVFKKTISKGYILCDF